MKQFEGKVVLVTGGTSGIGRAAAVAFGKEGAKVVVSGRRPAEGEETVALVKKAGGDARFVRADVAKDADVKALVAATVQAYGRLDFAFNNAGVEEEPGAYLERSEAFYDNIMDVNVKGVWLSMKYEIPEIIKAGGGAIVNNASIAGLIGAGGVAIYVASKHAVVGLTKSAALEFAKSNIRVNVVCPGAIETAMFERFAGNKPEFRERMLDMHPLGRAGRPEEIADAVVWLCSEKASFVTGVSLPLDGGYTAT
jgi:NAD(P)-dependent dehydrogenase (short-subunit alcohol dehydrogenase family)